MKKLFLLFAFGSATFVANAQLTLTGSSYTQDFNSLTTSGLPTGWRVYNSATSSSLGTIDGTYSNSTSWGIYYDTTNCPSSVFGHGFKNLASANTATSTMSCTAQQTVTDRALGVRQANNTTYPGFDPGPAFALQLSNTIGLSNFNLTFKLQSLDIAGCPRVTTWTVDYGLGTSPSTFTATSPTGTLTTGGNTFSNNTISVALPAALNNQSQRVWIRIATLAPTTGTGSRTTTAIDDYRLTWTGTPTEITNVTSAHSISINPIGIASSDQMKLAYTTDDNGNYVLNIYDLSGRVLHNETINATNGSEEITISNLHLAPGMYFVKFGNSLVSSIARVVVQ